MTQTKETQKQNKKASVTKLEEEVLFFLWWGDVEKGFLWCNFHAYQSKNIIVFVFLIELALIIWDICHLLQLELHHL